MDIPPTVDRGEKRRSLLLVAFSLLAMLVLTGRAAYLVVYGGLPLLEAGQAEKTAFAAAMLDAGSMLLCAALVAPVMYHSLRRLRGDAGQPAAIPPARGKALALLAVSWATALVLWTVLVLLPGFGWAVGIPFFLLGVALPVAGLAWVGAGGLVSGSRRRPWAALALGMVGGTGLALAGEYLIAGLAGGALLLANPDLAPLLERILRQLREAEEAQALISILGPYLSRPLVFLALLTFAAGFGPVIEEAVKPLAVLLAGRRLGSPAEGFGLGALCGAGFALIEGLLAASGAVEAGSVALLGRAASTLMHITASGLAGWGYASARLEKRYGRLLLTFLAATGIHGLWNGSALATVYGLLPAAVDPGRPNLPGIVFMLAGLGVLSLMLPGMLVLLPLLNHRLRPPVLQSPALPEVVLAAQPGASILQKDPARPAHRP